ncbi:uncharacterized protein LOC124132288 [Haliotis rufescens]|uniref:uncharacterized protein LOC124132288 n=1 Tax=Haliotis rufescens TaxID=6454 RepID=UPI00201EAA40|nr:uncharacterized protein LOC124132288 [Haliotis rufescens]
MSPCVSIYRLLCLFFLGFQVIQTGGFLVDDVAITIGNNKPQTTEDPGIKVTMASAAQLPMGNLTGWHTCTAGETQEALDLSGLTAGGEVAIPCVCDTQTNKTVTVNVSTELNSTQETFEIYCWDMLNITITLDKDLQPTNEVIPFNIKNVPNYGIQWNIDACENNTLTSTAASNYGSRYSANPVDLSSITYTQPGSCTLHATFWNELYRKDVELTFELGVGVADLTVVPSARDLLIGETFTLTVNATGPNISWVVTFFNATILQEGSAGVFAEQNASTTGVYTFGIIASNRVNNKSKSFDISVVHPINGYNVTVTPPTIQSNENLEINVALDALANIPMGTLEITISPCGNAEFRDVLPVSAGATNKFNCKFIKQGNYSIDVTISSAVSSENFTFEAVVCDNLTITIDVDKTAWAVGEPVIVNMNTLPTSGFKYRVDMGDGTSIHSNEADSVLVSLNTFTAIPAQLYNTPGTYTVSLYAYNQCYSVSSSVVLVVEYKIPPCNLVIVPNRKIMTPDDTTTFSFVTQSGTTADNPTNVTCTWNLGDGTPVTDQLTEMDFSSRSTGYVITHDYTTAEGTVNYQINCENRVSNARFNATVDVVIVRAADFSVTFEPVTPLPEGTCTNFDFKLSFHDIPKVPNDVNYTVNYADGDEVIEKVLSVYAVSKKLCKRGVYKGEITIIYDGVKAVKNLTYSLAYCSVTLEGSAIIGFVNTTSFLFVVLNHLFMENITVSIDWKDGSTSDVVLAGGASRTVSHPFITHGYMTPFYSVNTTRGRDSASLEEKLYLTYPAEDFELELPEFLLVGEMFAPIILYVGPDTLENISCTITFNSTANETLATRNFLPSDNSATSTEHKYVFKQYELMKVVCQNSLSVSIKNYSRMVFSECFQAPDMFESIHREEKRPMRANTASLPTLTARVKLADKCKNTTVFVFTWIFQKKNTLTGQFEPYDIETPNNISMNLANSTIKEGTYTVNLTMRLQEKEEDYLEDQQYLEIVNPPLVCSIVGGVFTLIGQGEILVLDAETNSYDPLDGIVRDVSREDTKHKTSTLNFSWACYAVDCGDTEAYMVPKNTDRSYRDKPQCNLTLRNEGYIKVDTAIGFENGKCYVFEQTLSKDNRKATAIKVVRLEQKKPCPIDIICLKNCMEKITPEEPTAFRVLTGSVKPVAAKFNWTLSKYDQSNADYSELSSADKKFKREPSDQLFELEPNYFTPGGVYKLQITADIQDRPQSIAFRVLLVNEKPRGGTCKITPTEGVALQTRFKILCDGWMDEGMREETDDAIDIKEPLKLKIIQDGNLIRSTDFTRKLSQPSVDLKAGPEPDFETEVKLVVTDAFGGQVEFTETVKVNNSMPPVPKFGIAASTLNKEEEEKQKKDFTDFLETIKYDVRFSAGKGAPLDTAVIASTVAKSLNTANFTTVTTEDVQKVGSEDADFDISLILEAGTTYNSIKENIKEVNEKFVESLTQAIDAELEMMKTTRQTLSADSITLLSESLATEVANPELLNTVTTEAAGKRLVALASNMMDVYNSTLKTVDVENMTHAVGSLLSSIIHCNKQYAITGVEVESSYNDSEHAGAEADELNAAERKYLKDLLKRKKQLKLDRANETLKENINSIMEAVSNMLKMASVLVFENSSSQVEQNAFIQYVKKNTASVLQNDPQGVNGSTLTVATVETEDNDEIIDSNLIVLKENPFVVGGNAKLVEHRVTVASMTRKDGKKLRLRGAVTTQDDPEDPPFEYFDEPKFTPNDPAKMLYHRFAYRSVSEQVCIRIIPMNDSVCYDEYLRASLRPTISVYDHHAKNITGHREYCAPAGSCTKTGLCWLGIRPFLCQEPELPELSRQRREAAVNDTSVTNTINNTIVTNTITGTSVTNAINDTAMLLTPYSLRILNIACLSWKGSDWDAAECTVKRDPDNKKTMCMCGDKEELITTVSFHLAPNVIDFNTVFSKFDINGQGAVLGTVLVCFVLFVIFLFWARYMDGQDVLQWGVTLLADNHKCDSYFYLITVHTGMVRGAGTKSNIHFCIAGEDNDTGVRILSDGVRKELKTGSTMHFLMAVPEGLGLLQYFRVWHDRIGDSTSWYLNRIEVTDLQTAYKADFLCYQWLSLEEGVLEKAIPVSSTENMKTFKTMFFEHARHHVTDDHLWVSVLLRPIKSHFSRGQRVGCCFTLLMLTMITNAMFFKTNSVKRHQTSDFKIGPISFSLRQIYVSFASTIIVAVPVFFIMLLFRKSKLSEKATKDATRLWIPHCFRNFNFYKQSKAIEKIMAIRDIVDDQDGVLPHFCVYISWVFAFICVFLSAFFIMLYSMEWGKDISEEWLMTFIMSFFESLIILDPVKVLVLAIMFAMLLKTLKASKPSQIDLNHIGRMNREMGQHGTDRSRLDYESPFSQEELQRATMQCRRRTMIRKVIQELLANSFFLWLLASISYSNRDPHGFHLHQNIKNTFIEPFKPAITLERVNTTAHYFQWLEKTVIPNLFPQMDFDNKTKLSPNMRYRISDLTNLRIGAPRLRQVRQANKTCKIPYVGETLCHPMYDLATEETRNWCQGWQPPKCPNEEAVSVTSNAWTFVSALDIWGLPITGKRTVYGGGGYIVELDITKEVAEQVYNNIYKYRWVDSDTRAVFLEFTLYNPSISLFCYVSILVEYPESGGVLESTYIFPFRKLSHDGSFGKYILFCEVAFIIFTMIWLGYITFKLMKDRWSFFKEFWNVVELVSVIFSFVAVVLYLTRLKYTNEAMALLKENKRVFINFYHIAVWDSILNCVLGFLVSIATLRLLRVMSYTRVTQIVFLVLKESSKTLPGFFFYILLVLFAFGIMGQVMFGANAVAYKDMLTTMETLFSGVLGNAGLRNTNVPVSDSWISLVYFVSFVLIVFFGLSNMFITILLDTMSLIGDDPKNLTFKEIELFAYMWESLKTRIKGKDTSKQLPDPVLTNTQQPAMDFRDVWPQNEHELEGRTCCKSSTSQHDLNGTLIKKNESESEI